MAGEFDSTTVIDQLLPTLHADTRAHLYFWTEADLIAYMDESLKKLASTAAIFIERDATTTTVPATATYPLPTRQLSTLHISLGTSALRPGTAAELEARDPQWQTTPGTPDHWYQDTIGIESVGLAPVPTTAAALPMICSVTPLDLDVAKANTLVQAPAPLKGYLTFSVIGTCYRKEGESEQPDLAQHCKARIDLYDKLLQHLYGEGI